MPDKSNKTSVANGDDYIRRIRKDVAKRQLERAAKRSKNTEEAKQEASHSSRKQTTRLIRVTPDERQERELGQEPIPS